MPFGVVEQALARPKVPLPPRGDDPDVGVQGIGTKFEPDLVVALPGCAVADGVGAGLGGDLDEPLGDERPGDRGAEQVLALVDGVGPEHGEHIVPDELLPEVLDVDLGHAHGLGLGPRRLELLALPEVGREGHDLAAVSFLQPPQDDRGVEPTGVGEDDLVDVVLVAHVLLPFPVCRRTGPLTGRRATAG